MKKIVILLVIVIAAVGCGQPHTIDELFSKLDKHYTKDSLFAYRINPEAAWIVYGNGVEILDSVLQDSTTAIVDMRLLKNSPITQEALKEIRRQKLFNFLSYKMALSGEDTIPYDQGIVYKDKNNLTYKSFNQLKQEVTNDTIKE